MKVVYQNKNSKALNKVNELIQKEVLKLEEIGHFGKNPDAFLEKYEDPFMDSYRETEKDFDISNREMLESSFEIAFQYLIHLRAWVGLECEVE